MSEVNFTEGAESYFGNMTVGEIEKDIYDSVMRLFDLEKVFRFCRANRVEVLIGADTQYHCHINYTCDGDSHIWAVEMHPLLAIAVAIKEYEKHNVTGISGDQCGNDQ